jgi:3-oxoacyl-[acyl-carrier protein] reductase
MIIVTGASGGIGVEIIPYLSDIDDLIAIYCNTSIPKNKKNEFFKLDITNEQDIEVFVKKYDKKLKDITLINMATYSSDGLLVNYKSEDWKKTFDINVNGPFYFIKNLLPYMIDQKYGRIINLSSFTASEGAIGASAYSASKSSIIGLTKSICKEYGRFNITSNIIELGYFDNGLTHKLTDQIKTKVLKNIPSGKFGKVDEIASVIELIINSSYINGSVIKINGGLS